MWWIVRGGNGFSNFGVVKILFIFGIGFDILGVAVVFLSFVFVFGLKM